MSQSIYPFIFLMDTWAIYSLRPIKVRMLWKFGLCKNTYKGTCFHFEKPGILQFMGSQRVRHYWVANTFTLLWDPVKAMDSPSRKGSTQSMFTFNMMCTMSESLEPSWVHVKIPYLPQKELLLVFKNEQKMQHRSFMKWSSGFRFCLSQTHIPHFAFYFTWEKLRVTEHWESMTGKGKTHLTLYLKT